MQPRCVQKGSFLAGNRVSITDKEPLDVVIVPSPYTISIYNLDKGGRVATPRGSSPNMASVVTAPSPVTSTLHPTMPIPESPESSATVAASAVPARLEVHMG